MEADATLSANVNGCRLKSTTGLATERLPWLLIGFKTASLSAHEAGGCYPETLCPSEFGAG